MNTVGPDLHQVLPWQITSTPSRRATVAAASDELRLECCIVSCTGRDHQRRGQVGLFAWRMVPQVAVWAKGLSPGFELDLS